MENTYMKSMPERWGIACRWIPSILIFTFLFMVSCQVEERNSSLGEFRINLTMDGGTEVVSKSSDDSVIPVADDFQITIESKDGTYSNYFERFADMDEYLTLPVGEYELKANYSRDGEEGFSAPTLGGSKSFAILKGQTTSVDVTCTLTSTKVTVNLAEEFVKYFSTYYSVGVKSANQKLFYFDEDTDEDLYLQPGELYMEVVATKQNGTSGVFYPLSLTDTKAAQHYVINLTVNGGEVGGETLLITFNDGVEDQEVEIDLSDAAINAKEPFFTTTGFTSGQVFEIAEGTDLGELSVLITARGGFQSCIVKTESSYLASQGWEPAIDIIGISTFDENLLKKFGLDWTPGLTTADNSEYLKMSELFFSGLIPLLRTYEGDDEHTFTLVVTDKNSKKSEELKLVVKTKEANFVLYAPEPVAMGSAAVDLTIDMEGDVRQVTIQYKDNYGIWHNVASRVKSSQGSTHVVEADLPVGNKNLEIRAVYNNIYSDVRTLEVVIPKFSLELENGEFDVWATKVYLKLVPENEDERSIIEKYLTIYANDEAVSVKFEDETLVVYGLTPGTQLTLTGTCDGSEYTAGISVTTEAGRELPNGDFEDGWEEFYNKPLQQGGRYRSSLLASWNTITKQLVINVPIGWNTVNHKTMPSNALNPNTWYIVPSTEQTEDTYNGNYAVKLKNVAWDNNGVSISDFYRSSLLGGASYCENQPNIISNRSVGKLFFGDYSYNHTTNEEVYDEGIEFNSRPTAITGYYKYTDLGNDGGGTVSITVEYRDGNNVTVLGKGATVLSATDSYISFNVPVAYEVKDKKATHLKVMFTSSTKSSYNQSEETANITTVNRNSTTEAISTGSELYLDNIQLNYE